MLSPARQHRIRVQAAAAKSAAADGALRKDLNQYQLHLAQLAEHRRSLKRIQSIQRKVDFKRKVLPEYVPYVAGVLAAQGIQGEPDDVLTTLMVWRIDTGDFAGALDIADYVLANATPLPDQYQRTAATTIAEEIADQALASKEPAQVLAPLTRTAALVTGHDMPDEVSAKLHKALGLAQLASDHPQQARTEFEQALHFNPHVGVKKDLERLNRQLKKNHSQPGTDAA